MPALIGGPAPVLVQAVTNGTAFFFDIDRVKRAALNDASLAWALAAESVHRLYDVLEELAGNTFASVRQRVARHLLDLATEEPGRCSRSLCSATSRTSRCSQRRFRDPERYLAGHPLMVVTLVFVQIVATLALLKVLATRPVPDASLADGSLRFA